MTFHLERRLHLAVVGMVALAGSSCVVTTHEGPGEPPRVVPPPPPKPSTKASARAESFGETFAEAPAQAEDRIGARHILVQFLGAKRSSSSRSREEARLRAEEALARLRAGEDFAALVREYSDEPGAAERGGDLGRFQRRMMVKAFADAAFALAIGEISPVIETEFGFHVIQRVE